MIFNWEAYKYWVLQKVWKNDYDFRGVQATQIQPISADFNIL
mgnify:CR=1 FL=1